MRLRIVFFQFKVFGCNIDPYYIGGRLYLYEPQLSDTGLYQCKVFRRDNKSFILEKNIPFFVLDESKFVSYIFKRLPRTVDSGLIPSQVKLTIIHSLLNILLSVLKHFGGAQPEKG